MIRTEQRPTLFNIFLIIQFVQNNITKKKTELSVASYNFIVDFITW